MATVISHTCDLCEKTIVHLHGKEKLSLDLRRGNKMAVDIDLCEPCLAKQKGR